MTTNRSAKPKNTTNKYLFRDGIKFTKYKMKIKIFQRVRYNL